MSILYATYRFIQREYHRPVRLWDSVIEELTAFVGVLPFLFASWEARWLPGLYAVKQLNCKVKLVLPALSSAADALGDVTPQQKNQLIFVCKPVFTMKISNRPEEPLKGIMQAVCVIKGALDPGWVDVQAVLEDPNFPRSLQVIAFVCVVCVFVCVFSIVYL